MPLQPLQDNLESQTYEVFEKDVTKYQTYEKAILQAINSSSRPAASDSSPAEPTTTASTSQPNGHGSASSRAHALVIMVVGAGRGPLVRASLQAAGRAGRSVHVYAVEKNPNAVITLHRLVAAERCLASVLWRCIWLGSTDISRVHLSNGSGHMQCPVPNAQIVRAHRYFATVTVPCDQISSSRGQGRAAGRSLCLLQLSASWLRSTPCGCVKAGDDGRDLRRWEGQVTVVGTDMRTWQPPELADILVSELLGSFGDNELSPECLDGAQRLLAPHGVSIPAAYSSFLQPITAAKLWSDARVGNSPAYLGLRYLFICGCSFAVVYLGDDQQSRGCFSCLAAVEIV